MNGKRLPRGQSQAATPSSGRWHDSIARDPDKIGVVEMMARDEVISVVVVCGRGRGRAFGVVVLEVQCRMWLARI